MEIDRSWDRNGVVETGIIHNAYTENINIYNRLHTSCSASSHLCVSRATEMNSADQESELLDLSGQQTEGIRVAVALPLSPVPVDDEVTADNCRGQRRQLPSTMLLSVSEARSSLSTRSAPREVQV